jgi:Coenzyme PQQ synthesis protein D (PqqD)
LGDDPVITYVARSSKLASRVLQGETIILSPKNSQLYSLNAIATLIWQEADGKSTLSEIVERRVCPEYEVDFETACKDANELVADLAGQGLFITSDRPIESVPEPYVERKQS